MYMYYYDSPMGVMKLCADEESLLGVWFDEERIAEASLDIEAIENLHDNKHISDAVCWLDEYFAGNVSEAKAAGVRIQKDRIRDNAQDSLWRA